MICDLETGICGDASDEGMEVIDLNAPKKEVTIYYVTDPICSHCWALEPVLRRFEEQYGQYFKLQTVMGGLLESWEGFADKSNGISAPADVAGHWREVGEHSRMPIDGSLWLDNPVQSSYPPSRVFKIIQKQDEQLAKVFLRRAREAVFAFNRNIGEAEILIDIVNQLGLDGQKIIEEAQLPHAQQLLNEDFVLSRSLGVRGFPSIIMVNEENKGVKIVGARPTDYYVNGLKQALSTSDDLLPAPKPSLKSLLEKEIRLFSREIEEMYEINQNEVQSFLQKELSEADFQSKEILGELYIESN